jgi:hypothetical protein
MFARLSRFFLPPLIVVVALIAYRFVVIRGEEPAILLPRNEPLKIEPRFADERVVTDAQLVAVLERVKPPADVANTNNFVHALRLWGAEAEFADPTIPTGRELLDYFLDDAAFRRFAGDTVPPLFYRGANGVEVRSFDDRLTDRTTSSYHTNDLVATLAETGTPLDATLHLRDGEAQVGDVLKTALSRFHLEQLEYEWTAIAYARYVFPQRDWRNKFGEKIDVERLVDELISHPPHHGPCNGLHRLEAMVVLCRADEQAHALRPRTRQKMLLYMKQAGELLVQAQSAEGFWTRDWPRGAAVKSGKEASAPLHDKLLVTGHHLEWLALAPEEVQPPRETVIRASQWLARTLVEMDENDLAQAYGPYSHAVRALCLWRGVEPYTFWRGQHAKPASQVAALPPSALKTEN